MADRTRTITLKINDQFSRELKEFVRQMDNATNSTKKLDQPNRFQNLNKDLFYLQQNVTAVANAFGTVFTKANEWAQMGLGAERSKIAFSGLAGDSETAAKWIEAINEGARGSLTEGESAALGYRLMRFGLADTEKEAEKFIDTVSKIALINPQLGSTDEAINQIQLTLSNMSYMRLDQLGISAGTVRKRVAELKNEIEGLSTEDAFRMAVLEQLNEQADLLGDNVIDMDDAMLRFNARWRTFKEDAGLKIATGFEAIAEGAEGLLDALNKLGAKEFIIQLGLSVGQNLGILDEEGREEFDVWRQLLSNPKALMGWIDPKLFYAAENFEGAVNFVGGLFGGGGGRPSPRFPELPATYGSIVQASPIVPPGGLYGLPPGYYRETDLRAMGLSDFEISQLYRAPGYNIINPGEALWEFGQGLKTQGPQPTVGSGGFRQGIIGTMYGRGSTLGLNYLLGEAWTDRVRPALEGAMPDLMKIRDAVGEVAGRWVEVMGATFDALKPAERYANLADKFGIDPHSFDVDLFNRMTDALEGAEVPVEQMEDAMRRFEHQTGMANAQSEIFDTQMENITERFKIGELTAQQYIDAVTWLSQLDFSGIQSMMGPLAQMDMDAYITMLDRIRGLSPDLLMQASNMPAMVQGVVSNIQDYIWGPQGEGEGAVEPTSPLAPMLADMNEITSKFETVETDWGVPVMTFQSVASAEFETMYDNAAIQIENIKADLDELSKTNFKVTVDIVPSALPSGGRDGATYDAVVAEASRRNEPIKQSGFVP